MDVETGRRIVLVPSQLGLDGRPISHEDDLDVRPELSQRLHRTGHLRRRSVVGAHGIEGDAHGYSADQRVSTSITASPR